MPISTSEMKLRNCKKRKIDLIDSLQKQEALTDFGLFTRRYLPHVFSQPSPRYHDDILSMLMAPERGKRIVIAEPRGFGKTTRMRSWVLQQVIAQKYRYVMYVSSSEGVASKYVSGIRDELKTNEQIVKDYGDLLTKKRYGVCYRYVHKHHDRSQGRRRTYTRV